MITLQKANQLKSIAILMMLFLHLFNRDHKGLFTPLIFIADVPLSYYISLFSDACVPIFAFVSGYGLYFKFRQDSTVYSAGNKNRLKNLYVNYWIVILFFAVGMGTIVGLEGYPGSLQKAVLNLTAINPSYNPAWWFLTIYILFVLTSRLWFSLMEKLNPTFYLILLLFLYLVAFYLRVYKTDLFTNNVAQWMHRQFSLYFCTLFQFMLGAFALRHNWQQKVGNLFRQVPSKGTVVIGGIVLLIILHGVIPNFIVAPFTGLGFIFLFLQLDLTKLGNRILDFFTPHATNLWLLHMFFYMIYFQNLIYSFEYVIPIFLALVVVSLLGSYIVNYSNQFVRKWV